MLTKISHREILTIEPLALLHHHIGRIMINKGSGMRQHSIGNLTKCARRWNLTTCKCIDQIREQPRPTKASTTDYDSIAPGLIHHVERILSFPNVAIAQHWNVVTGVDNKLFELRDRAPPCITRIVLLNGSRVHCYPCGSLVGTNQRSVSIGSKGVVEAHPELCRHRNTKRFGGFHRSTENCSK